jgi:hypothetical protein
VLFLQLNRIYEYVPHKETKVRKIVLMDLHSWTGKGMTDIKSSFGQDVTL